MALDSEALTHFGRKLQFLASRGPHYCYIYCRWRLRDWLRRISPRSCDVDDPSLLAEVDLDKPEVRAVKSAVDNGNTDVALTELVCYFRARQNPVFLFDEQARYEITSMVPSDVQQATIRSAEKVANNTFEFRGRGPIVFTDRIDWHHRPQGNIDWTWDLNRHTCFVTLGRAYGYTSDERYAQKYRSLLLDWTANNPAHPDQPNWDSVFEVAFRVNTWTWAFYYFRSSTAFDSRTCLELLKGLLTHGRYLDAHLELHVPNNHLLLEAKALALLGILFPEFKQAKRWRERGLKILDQQLRMQVCADGVHRERTTLYHRIIAGELLELLVLMDNNNLPLPPRMVETLERMLEFELWLTKPDDRIPLFGDSALEDTYLRFPAVFGGAVFFGRTDLNSAVPPPDEASIWLLGPNRIKQFLETPAKPVSLGSRAFTDGGYFVMRAGQDSEAAYLAFDCGPFGYKLLPSHGHADALSFEMYAAGQTLLVDPGVYGTQKGTNWRNFFRGTRAHNTVVVDEQDQSILMDTQRVHRPARATLHTWLTHDQFDFVDGSHDGYERLSGPITHRRQIFFAKPDYWVVLDLLLGQGQHCFDLLFHLLPDADPWLDEKTCAVHTGSRSIAGLAIVPLYTPGLQAEFITGATAPIQGWVSFYSGEKMPAPTLRYRKEECSPSEFCTVLYPYADWRQKRVSVTRLEIEGPAVADKGQITGLCVETESHTDYLVVDRGPAYTQKAFAGYATDARLAYVRHEKGDNKLMKAIAIEGRQMLYRGKSIAGICLVVEGKNQRNPGPYA